MRGMRNSAHFCVFLTVVMVLTKSNLGPYKSLQGPYLALVRVPGNCESWPSVTVWQWVQTLFCFLLQTALTALVRLYDSESRPCPVFCCRHNEKAESGAHQGRQAKDPETSAVYTPRHLCLVRSSSPQLTDCSFGLLGTQLSPEKYWHGH